MSYSDQNNIESEARAFLTCPASEKKENMLTFPTSSESRGALCPQWASPIIQHLRNF